MTILNAAGQEIRSEEEAETQTDAAPVLTIQRLLASALWDTEKSGVQISRLLVDAVRKNDKRAAQMTFAVPNEWSRSATGDPEMQDCFLVLRLDGSWVRAMVGDA